MKSQKLYWYDLFNRRASRRDFLRVSGNVAGLIALGTLPACQTDRAPRFRSNPFTLGVASGDPIPDGVVLWTRLARQTLSEAGIPDRAVPTAWEIAQDEGFQRIVQSGSTLAVPELGHSVHTEVAGLEPGRTYWYRFNAGGEASPVGRTRTAPAVDASPERFRFAFVSCQQYEAGYYTAYRHIAEEDLDLLIHLGDYIYEGPFSAAEISQRSGNRGQDFVLPLEAREVLTLDDYRAQYALYKSDAKLQAAHAAFPWVVTTDDHEVDNNYADRYAADDQSPEQFLLRRAAAYQAYYEFMPLRKSSLPVGPDMTLYRRLRFGDLVEFNVLDTRQYRSDQPCGDGRKLRCEDAYNPEATMMGPDQEAWLMEGLRASSAKWNVLANQVMMAQLARPGDGETTYAMDRWDGYVQARRRLMSFLAQVQPSNPVVITGDIHSNFVADLKEDFDDLASPVVATEFVGTSITSGGDGTDALPREYAITQSANPHFKFYNGQRGYVRATITRSLWTSDYRVVPYVSRPDAPIEPRAAFALEDGRLGVQAV